MFMQSILSHPIVTLHSAAASCYRNSINYQGGLRDPCGYSNPSRELNSALVSPPPPCRFLSPTATFVLSFSIFCSRGQYPHHYSISSLIAAALENTKGLAIMTASVLYFHGLNIHRFYISYSPKAVPLALSFPFSLSAILHPGMKLPCVFSVSPKSR